MCKITIIAAKETGYFDFELGYVTEENYWEQVCMAFNVGRLVLYDTKEAITEVSGSKVFLEAAKRAREIGKKPIYLKDFVHPNDAVYVFGRTGNNNVSLIEKNDVLLSVEQANDKGDMFALTMASIVLRDRFLKYDN